ncbi:MaoC/PaaZ C-terminal domain-containing protein [Halorarius litoreus]|uniref:MaoC/PaaZ C-terminal domain-containing protein n=1 Tax=Halorarius litoreus TaxID=2962676 RepID=UPI0020CD8F2B|nr:MaoC/PaaZ C-terminal domain-containing protein [Halorarius litoreus]
MPTRYAEDLAVGDEFTFGSHTVTTEEIIEFAEEFDPQPFHTDEAAATESMFGGLVASGWHVVSLTNRMLTDSVFSNIALQGGHGTDEVRFPAPTRPGDTLSGTVEIVDISEPEHRPQHRDVDFAVTTRNDDGPVLTMTNLGIVARRESADED